MPAMNRQRTSGQRSRRHTPSKSPSKTAKQAQGGVDNGATVKAGKRVEGWEYELLGNRLTWTDCSARLGRCFGLAMVLGVGLVAFVAMFAIFAVIFACIFLLDLIRLLFTDESFAAYLSQVAHSGTSWFDATWPVALMFALTVVATILYASALPFVVRFEFDLDEKTLTIWTRRPLLGRTQVRVVPFDSLLEMMPFQDWQVGYFAVRFVKANGRTDTLQLGRNLPLDDCLAHIEWLRPTLGDKLQPICQHES